MFTRSSTMEFVGNMNITNTAPVTEEGVTPGGTRMEEVQIDHAPSNAPQATARTKEVFPDWKSGRSMHSYGSYASSEDMSSSGVSRFPSLLPRAAFNLITPPGSQSGDSDEFKRGHSRVNSKTRYDNADLQSECSSASSGCGTPSLPPMFLGEKHSLGPCGDRSKRTFKVVVDYNTNGAAAYLQARHSDLLTKIRRSMQLSDEDNFRFCYKDGVPVQLENEPNTRVKSCLTAPGETLHISSRPHVFRVTESCLAKVSHGAEVVIRTCLVLLETFETAHYVAEIPELPNALDACVCFFRNLARAATSVHQGADDKDESSHMANRAVVSWELVERRLKGMEKTLRLFLDRDPFVALMSYKADIDALSNVIGAIQKELLSSFSSKLPDDHPVYFVRMGRPHRSIESLLKTLARTDFMDLCGEKHTKTRRKIAGLLDVDEAEVIKKITHKGSVNIFETGMFRDAVPPSNVTNDSLLRTSQRDFEKIKDLLAPRIDSQEALISQKAEDFNQRTSLWAMKAFDAWVNDVNSSHKCFLLVGNSASGKTTLMSHIIRSRKSVVLASHFCRHDDVTTSDPKVMLLSIAYQLCLQSASFEKTIRGLLVGLKMTRKQLLSSQYPIASLFRDFLAGPLQSMVVKNNHRHCIVIEGIELGGQLGSDQNPIVRAIRNNLKFLPPWLNLVLSSRPIVSVLKQLRSFNAKMVERDADDTLKDLTFFFQDALRDSFFFNKESREAIADQLAVNARGNYVYASLLKSKAHLAQRLGDESLFTAYTHLELEVILNKDLDLVLEIGADLFWKIVRLSLVAFRALDKSDVVVLTGCTIGELDDMLHRARTFFVITDTSVIRFGQKLVKQWLLDRICQEEFANNPAGICEGTKARYDHAVKFCHRLFSRHVLDVLERSRSNNQFYFANNEIKEYVFLYCVRHMIHAGMVTEARTMLLDPTMLVARAPNCDGMIEDLSLISNDDEMVELVLRALTLSKEAIEKDPRQIVSQLVGRLKAAASENRELTTFKLQERAFVDRLETHDYGFDWWCPVSQTWDSAEETLVKRLKGHNGQVQGVHLSHQHCASACWDGIVRVWDIASGKCEVAFSGHEGAVWCVNWDNTGQRIASGGVDKTVRIWNYESQEEGLVLPGHEDCIFSVKFSPDAKLVASASKDGSIRVWNSETGLCRKTLRGTKGFVYSVDWKPNSSNRYLCSGGTDKVVRVWDIQSSSCINVLKGHDDWVRSCCWSVNGLDIFSGSSDRTVMCWDVESGECNQVLMGSKGGIWSVAQSSDGRYVFAACIDNTIKIWDSTTWRCDQTLVGHEGAVLSLSISNDGSTLVSGGADNSLIVWDCEVERETSAMDGHSKPVWDVDVNPLSTHLVSASTDHTARLWNIKTNLVERVFTGHTGPVWSAKFSHSGRHIATASSDTTAAVYRISTGGRKWTLCHSDAVSFVVWSKDDKALFTACRDLVIRRWDARKGSCAAIYQGHTKDIKSLSVSPNGLRLASASLDTTVRVWNISTTACEHSLSRKKAGALSVDWMNDKELAAGYTSGCVRLWNSDTEERLIGFLPGHQSRTNAVSCSPDGKYIVSASVDKELRIWNIAHESCERRIDAHKGLGVFCVKWSPTGNHVFSGGSDRAIRMWDTESGRCESVFSGEGGIGIYEVSWAPSGELVASGSCDRTVQIWDSDSGKCLQTFNGHTNWVHSVDWEKGGRRVLSRSDDGTARLWNLETGSCDKIYNEDVIPDDFELGSAKVTTVSLSDEGSVGIQCQKVRICGERCCGWIGKKVYFFKLRKGRAFEKSLEKSLNGAMLPDILPDVLPDIDIPIDELFIA